MKFSTHLLSALTLLGVTHAVAIDITNGTSIAETSVEINDTFAAGTTLAGIMDWQRFSWRKKGKKHCLLQGVYPCVRDCTKKNLVLIQKPKVGECEDQCGYSGKFWSMSDESCTDSSDDDFGYNLPLLIEECQREVPDWKPSEKLLHSADK